MRLSIVIPCLDEARTIGAVVDEAKRGLAECGDLVEWSEVIVADNGSKDGSRDIAAAGGAVVVPAPIRGYGAALHWGIAGARGDFVLLADADKSHDLMLARRFVEAARADEVDVILGSRLRGEIRPGAMAAMNRLVGTPALNFVIWICFGLRTSDCNSGMRLIRRGFYRSLGMRCPGMEWASEMLIKTALRRGRYAEVAIHVRPDERGRPPHLRRWRDGWRHLKSIVMLAPNVTILSPSILVASAGAALLASRPYVAFACFWFAYVGLLVGGAIKLVLHVDGVRPSRVIAALERGRAAEIGLLLALALAIAGVATLARETAPAALVGGALLLSAGGVTAFGVLYWETVRTLLVSSLDSAWETVTRLDAEPTRRT